MATIEQLCAASALSSGFFVYDGLSTTWFFVDNLSLLLQAIDNAILVLAPLRTIKKYSLKQARAEALPEIYLVHRKSHVLIPQMIQCKVQLRRRLGSLLN